MEQRASGLVDPPPLAPHKDTDYPNTILSGADAFALQAALVGNSLAMETGRRVPWSVADYSVPALEALFDGRQTFTRRPIGYATTMRGVPAPPEISLAFLRAQPIVGADRHATIVRVLAWCRDRMTHFAGAPQSGTFELHWQYRGHPPVSRVISGTRYTGGMFSARFDRRRHFTGGCWGTASFLAAVLRTLNIPVSELSALQRNTAESLETHSVPHFLTEDLCLSHGDDPYNNFCRIQPSFDIERILITRAQFDRWFPPGVTPVAGAPRNVGRRVTDLSIELLPIRMLLLHSQDVTAQRRREAGRVFADLKDKYALADLDRAELWPRLDARLAALGGPEKVRDIYFEAALTYDRQAIATAVP